MIRSFRHKGLQRLHLDGETRGVLAEHAEKLNRILSVLNTARSLKDMDLPGYRLHPLAGEMSGYAAVTVRANWRVVFRIENGEVFDVDYLDYH